MPRLQDELFEVFSDQDCRHRVNKHGNTELVLSPEAADHLATLLHAHDDSTPEGWGKL